MTLRIPLTQDTTLRTTMEEIERRLRKLEKRTGVSPAVGNTTVQIIGNSGSGLTINNLIQRIEALEEALENVPQDAEDLGITVFGGAGPSAHEGLVPSPEVHASPDGITQAVLTEDATFEIPHRGLVQVVTPGDETVGADKLELQGSLHIAGDLSANKIACNDLSAHGTILGRVEDPLEIESDLVSVGNVDILNVNSGTLRIEPDYTGRLRSECAARWRFEETSGVRVDEIHGLTLTDPTLVGYAAGKYGNAASFSRASSQYLTLSSPGLSTFVPGNFTVSVLFWMDGAPINTDTLISAGNANFVVDIIVSGNVARARLYYATPQTNEVYTEQIQPNQWNHVLAWFDGTFLSIRVNNGPITSTPYQYAARTPSPADVYVGSINPAGRYFNGRIDSIDLWPFVVTQAEAERIFTRSRASLSIGTDLNGLAARVTVDGATDPPYDVVDINAGLHVAGALSAGSVTAKTVRGNLIPLGLLVCCDDELTIAGVE